LSFILKTQRLAKFFSQTQEKNIISARWYMYQAPLKKTITFKDDFRDDFGIVYRIFLHFA